MRLCKIDATERYHNIYAEKRCESQMHGSWIALSAGEGKTDISKGTNPLIAERNHKNQEIRADVA